MALFQGTINIDNILSDKYFFYSTVPNVAPQAVQTATAAEDLTETVEEVEQEAVSQDRQEPTSSTASSTAPKSRKKVSKKQQFHIELSERILNSTMFSWGKSLHVISSIWLKRLFSPWLLAHGCGLPDDSSQTATSFC